MKDLRNIIKAILEDAEPIEDENGGYMDAFVSMKLLRVLQAEYNIHFVEPEDEQLEVLC